MKISTILPLYNGKKYIKEAIDSVLAQTYKNWELIIINDGSTDDSYAYVQNYLSSLKENDKITLIDQANTDVAIARNNAIKQSHGEWIALLDQDDYFHADKFKTMLACLEKDPNIDVFVSNRYRVHKGHSSIDESSTNRKKIVFSSNDILEELIINPQFMPVDTLFRKSAFEEVSALDSSLRMANDWDLWIRLAQNNSKFFYIEKALAYYRVHDDNTTHNFEGFVEERFRILDKFFTSCEKHYLHLKKKAYASAYAESANPRYKAKMYEAFQNDVKEIIRLDKSQLTGKLLKRFVLSYVKKAI